MSSAACAKTEIDKDRATWLAQSEKQEADPVGMTNKSFVCHPEGICFFLALLGNRFSSTPAP
jgi:hypothetical protein